MVLLPLAIAEHPASEKTTKNLLNGGLKNILKSVVKNALLALIKNKFNRGARLNNAHLNLKTKHMKTASKIIRYIIAAIILYAVLSYCQEINDCLMKY